MSANDGSVAAIESGERIVRLLIAQPIEVPAFVHVPREERRQDADVGVVVRVKRMLGRLG
jgi:hypothetical protein